MSGHRPSTYRAEALDRLEGASCPWRESRDALLADAVLSTPPTARHAIVDALVTVARATLADLPVTGRCECGFILVSDLHVTAQGQAQAASWALGCAVGWIPQGAHWTSEGVAKVTGAASQGRYAIVAPFLCPGCHRLYALPDGWTRTPRLPGR